MNLQLLLNGKKRKKKIPGKVRPQVLLATKLDLSSRPMLPSTQAAPYLAAEGTAVCDPCWQVTKKQAACWRKKNQGKKKCPLGSISVMFKAFLGRIMYSFFLVLSW